MDEVQEKDVLRMVQRKFPVCNVIDARVYGGSDISEKCNDAPSVIGITLGKKKIDVTLCTGSFNVYVLKIEENI